MRKYKRALLSGLLASAFAFMPVVLFGSSYSENEVRFEKAQFGVGVYFGRPYGYGYYRPYYYRPYYYGPYSYRPYYPYRSYNYYY